MVQVKRNITQLLPIGSYLTQISVLSMYEHWFLFHVMQSVLYILILTFLSFKSERLLKHFSFRILWTPCDDRVIYDPNQGKRFGKTKTPVFLGYSHLYKVY